MWKPPEEVRLRRAADWLIRNVPEIWHTADHKNDYGQYPVRLASIELAKLPQPQRQYYDATFEGLAREFGASMLDQVVPELHFFTGEGLYRDPPEQSQADWWPPRMIAFNACRMWIEEHAPDYAVRLAVDRLRYIVSNGLKAYELPPSRLGGNWFFRPPDAEACESLLVRWRDRPVASDAIRELLEGAWDCRIELPPAIRQDWMSNGKPHLIQEYEGCSSYRFFGLSRVLRLGVLDAAAFGELSVERLHDLTCRTPHAVPVHVADREHSPQSEGERAVRPLITESLWQIVQKLDEHSLGLAYAHAGTGLVGQRFVLKACEHIEAGALESIDGSSSDRFSTVMRWLADAHLDDSETVEALAEQLCRFTPATLKAVLPHASSTDEAFLTALGWTAAIPLLRLTRRMARRDAPNCPDPTSGVVERGAICLALESAGRELARELLATFEAGQIPVTNTATLVEAIGGWNRKQILRGLARLTQINLKAFGLLPLERGHEEVVERYQTLRQAARACRKFGAERQANIRAAVEAGLANLAQTAGYEDLARMEWDVEASIAEASADSRSRVGDYEVALEMPELDPVLVVRRAGRSLASIPPAVRRSEEYATLRESLGETKAQVARFRRSLEDAMTEARPFTAADLTRAPRVPALERLLGRLVLRHPDGICGLLVAEGLRGLDGAILPFVDGVQVAHPMQLIEDGVLAAWQHAIVAGRIAQPFKQVFREVYSLTAAERNAEETQRFAGHRIDGRVLGRLLSARGWEVMANDVPRPFRRYREAGLRAWFDFPDARHFVGDGTLTSAALSFTREVASGRWWETGPRVALAEVPPIVISETFRDADLMVAVARAGDDALSAESYERRGETVVALAQMLGVSGVERDGRFVRVRGSLASYRVHVGSATVQVEPANVLCILPEPGHKKTDGIWLPFAEEDERLAEVVSKVLLLASDDSIKDPAIRAQIVAAAGAPTPSDSERA